MADIASVGSTGVGRTKSASGASRGASRLPAQVPVRGSDRAEVSVMASYLSKLSALPDIRQDLVDRVRAEIASGGYESPEKLDQAVGELLKDLSA